MGMFEKFTKTKYPDNRFKFLPEESIDEIIIGASCKHIFKIPAIYTSIVKSGSIIYSQGIDFYFSINITEDMITEFEDCNTSIVTVKLPVNKTMLFKEDRPGNSTKCQLKLILNNGETQYDVPHKLKVYKGLDIHEAVESKDNYYKFVTSSAVLEIPSDAEKCALPETFKTQGVTVHYTTVGEQYEYFAYPATYNELQDVIQSGQHVLGNYTKLENTFMNNVEYRLYRTTLPQVYDDSDYSYYTFILKQD